MKIEKKILLIVSCLLVIKSILSFFIFRYILHASLAPALITASLPLFLGLSLFYFKDDLTNFIQTKLLPTYKKNHWGFYLIMLITSIALYLTITHILLLSHSILWQDEWRHFNDYLFEKDLLSSILDRQNGHLMIFPNIIFLLNYYLLDGQEIWLILLNLIILSFAAFIIIRRLFTALQPKLEIAINIACCAVMALSIFWLAGDVSLFWGIGIHNNLAALGTTITAHILSKKEDFGNYKGMLYFTIGALFASCTFGPGAATWALGFIAAILWRQKLNVIISYFVIGILGGFLTIGYYTLTTTGVSAFHLVPFTKSIPAFLGIPFVQIFSSLFSATIINNLAIGIGIIGIFTFLGYLYFFFKDNAKNEANRIFEKMDYLSFHLLLASFGIVCGVLISLGRVKTDFTMILDRRYHSWAVIFWSSLFAVSCLLLVYLLKNKYKNLVIGTFLSIVLTGLTLFNFIKIDLWLNAYNNVATCKLDLIVHPDTKGNETGLWQKNLNRPSFRRIVLDVTETLKTENKNFYAEEWPHWMGKTFSEAFILKNDSELITELTYFPNQTQNEVFIQGWVHTASTFDLAPSKLVFVYKDKVIGIGLPFSDRDEEKPNRNPSLANMFNLLPRPFKNLPGFSNFYSIQINMDMIGQGGFDSTALKGYGVFNRNICKKLNLDD